MLNSNTIGSKVQSIGVAAFGGCENLASIIVDSDNAWFCSKDGVLFSNDMTILVEYPPAKSDSTYTVPSSVVEIVDYAFMSCNNLTSVTTTANVTKIGYSAFLSCKSLETLTLPEGITLSVYGCSNYVSTTYIQTIDPVALSDCTISLATNSYTYDGVAKKPTVTVKNGSTTLKEGRDYSVSYSDNKNAGTAKVTIMGISEYYTGTVTKTFTIQKASQTIAGSLSQTEIAVGSSATITATGIGTISYSSSDTGVATVSSSGKVTAKTAGTAVITIKAAGNSNYKSASTTLNVTVTSTASTDGVSLSTLTYSFSNSRSAYGYSSSYKIPLARYKLFYSDQLASTYYSNADTWGGSCYGMSTTSSMFNTSGSTLTVSSFNSSATKVSDLAVSNKNSTLSMTVTQLIEAMQVSQFSYSLASERTSTNGDLDELVSIVKEVSSGGTMPVICVFYKTNGGTGGHALLGYKVEKKSSSVSYLYVYDCNYPNTERYITLYTNSSGAYTGYYYKINDTYNCGSNYSGSSIKYNTYAAYQEVWAGRNGASVSSVNQLLVQSDSFEIQDANGTTVAVMEDGEFTSWSEDVYQLELVDMDELNGTLVYMPLEAYTVCDTSGDASKEFELTMVNDSQSVSVTTQADSVSFLVDDEQAVGLAQIDGENGELYEVTVSSSLEDYSSDQETVTYSGKCEEDIITIGTVSGEYVAVNYTGCGVAVEDAIINCTTDIISDTSGITDISSGYTMALSDSSFGYTGERIEPEVTVTDSSSNVLVNGKDYIVVYENNTEIGTATATAYGINNYTGTITVSFAIETGAQTITASAGSTSIAYGKTTTITASTTGDGALSYSSSNTSVATVDSSGKVTAKGAGTATITVTAAATTNYTEATKTVKITVTRASQSLTVSSSSVTLAVKGTSTITVSGNKTTLSYSSSDTSVATVNSSGVITAKKVGTATITVTAAQTDQYAKATKTITVKVKPVAPTNVSVANTSSGVKITWDKVTGATGYYVYRSTSKSGTYTKIATIKSGSTVTYTNKTSGDYKAANAKTYYYKVYAYASTGTSSASSVKSIRFITAGKVSSLTNASGGITVKWSKVSGATGYYIYRKAGSDDYKKIATVTGASTVSYTNKTSGTYKVVNGTTYKYYVIPYYKSSSGTITKGSYSNTKTIIYLTAGKLSSVKNASSKKMTVKWSKNTKATGYQIQYSTSSSFASSKTTTVKVTSSSTVSKTISKLTKGKTYYVRVRSYKKSGSSTYYSEWSSKKSVKISK